MMGLLDNSPQIDQSRRRDKVEIFMIHMTEELIKIHIDQIVETGEFNLVGKVEVDQDMNRAIGQSILEITQEYTKIMGYKIVEKNTRVIIGMKITTEKEEGVSLGKDHFQRVLIIEGMIEAQVIVNQGQNQE